MKRRELLAAAGTSAIAATAGCLGAPTSREPTDPSTPDVAAVTDWPMFLYDERNRRCFDGAVRPGADPGWTRETDDAIWASPVVADGTVYVGSYDGDLYAVSAEDGEVRWRFPTGDRIDGTAAVADGTVYVGSFDRNIYALDAESGDERWVYGNEGIVRSSPTVADGTVYIGTHCRVEECSAYYDARWPTVGYVLALDAETGDLEWRYETGDGVLPKPAVHDGTVYATSSDSTVYALDAADGSRRWDHATAAPIMGSPVARSDAVVVGDLSGTVTALTPGDGERLWDYRPRQSDDPNVIESDLITSSPTLCGDTVYVGAIRMGADRGPGFGELWAIDAANGERRWRAGPFGQMIGSSPTVIGDEIYVGAHTNDTSPDHNDPGVFAIADGGAVSWRYTVDPADHRGFGSSPTVADDRLFIGGWRGTLYAFDLEERETADPEAVSLRDAA
ncbi:MAG: PQQ-binding-like beta-propeller repeat protein [Halobacteriales archaeon]